MSILFVDESKAKGYTMAAALVASGNISDLRQSMRALVLPGQRRLHFTKERANRRRLILSRMADLGVRVQVFHCTATSDAIGREACLIGLVDHAAKEAHTKIVIERDQSIEQSDRKILFREVKKHKLTGTLTYALEDPYLEPLLWIPDAVAWSYSKGGDWKRRAEPLIVGTTTVAG